MLLLLLFIYIYTHTHIYIYICTYTHRHTHIHIFVMGVHYLVRNLEYHGGRLPFKITFNPHDNFYMESDAYIEDYKHLGNGNLQYIGIDGSVIIHGKIGSVSNNNNKCTGVDINKSAKQIVNSILTYVKTILIFFHIFEEPQMEKKNKPSIILHFVIDGTPPCKKNRRKILDHEGNETYIKDAYSLMSLEDKKKLHKKIINYLKKSLKIYNENNNNQNNNKHNIELLTNYRVNVANRGEGELELYKFCHALNQKKISEKKQSPKNVIVSSDSDVVAMMLMHGDKNLIIISPLAKNIFITNYTLLTRALNLTTQMEITKYVLLHFIFFGSDYNLGLMSNPNNNKQNIILDSVKNPSDFPILNDIGKKCHRKRKLNNNNKYGESFLQNFKDLLIYEAICAFMYYFEIENGEKFLLEYSPRLYESSEAKRYISLINF